MNSIYVLLFTFLLYIFFGTLVDVFLATDSKTLPLRIKIKVFFHTFAAPAIFAFVLLFIFLTGNKAFDVFFGFGLIAGSLIRAVFGKRNYLINFNASNSQININYLTSLLKTKEFSLNSAGISRIEIEKANWLIDFPASVNIKHNGEWINLYLIDKKLKIAMKSYVDEANNLMTANDDTSIYTHHPHGLEP